MQLKYLTMLFAVVALSLAAVACSGDDDDTSSNGDQPAATTEAPSDGDGNGDSDGDPGSGEATLSIGDETWDFDGIFCAFSPEEAGNDRVSFTLSSSGQTAEGVRTFLDATIQDTLEQGRYEGDDVIHSVTLDDVEDFENPSVAWGALSLLVGSSEIDFQIDGKNVRVEAVFDDGTTDDIETVPGTLTATCP